MRACVPGSLALLLVLAGGAGARAEEVKLGKPVDLVNVGLRIAFPADLPQALPDSPDGLWMAWENRPDPKSFVCFYGFPAVDSEKASSLKQWAERLASRAATRPGGVQATVVSSTPFQVAGSSGWRTVSKVTAGTRRGFEVGVLWEVRRPQRKLKFRFTLGVGVGEDDADLAKARAQAICASVQNIPVQSPSQVPLPPLVVPVVLREERFAMALPAGWTAQHLGRKGQSNMILSASAMDYTLAKALPNVNVTAVKTRSPRGPDLSSKQHADMLVAHLQEAGKAAQWTLVATQPSKLAGRDALQIAARLEAGGQKACQVQRQGFHGGRIYTLTLTYAGHDTARALAAMAKIARRCVFLPAAATRPAATQAASTQRKAQP